MGKRIMLAIFTVFMFALPVWAAQTIDYGDEASFEAALKQGENLEGKIVQFTAREFHPESALGYNLWAGEHLNFVSARHPDAKAGDTLVVRTDTITNMMGSWVINYTKIDDAVAGDTTIYSTDPASNSTVGSASSQSTDSDDIVIEIFPSDAEANSSAQVDVQQPTSVGSTSGNVPIWIPTIENMTLTGEYAYPGTYQDRFNYVLFFKNDTGADAKFIVRATARDAARNIVGVSDDSYVFVNSGYEVPVVCRFTDLNYYDVVGINYAMSEDVAITWKAAQNLFTYQSSETDDKVIVTVTNNSEKELQQICGYVFYFNGDKMVDNQYTYFSTVGKMTPGVQATEEFRKPTNVTYDSIKVYVTGVAY